MMARRGDGPERELSYVVLWAIRGARLGGPHAELGNRGSSHSILLAWGSRDGLRGGRGTVSSEGRPCRFGMRGGILCGPSSPGWGAVSSPG